MTLQINDELDVDYLNQVYGDDAMIIHLIFNAFISDSLPRWQALKASIDGRDLDSAASIIHGLKPSFTMAGMTWLRPPVEDFERAIKAKADTGTLQTFYSNISKELDKITPVLQSEADRLGDL